MAKIQTASGQQVDFTAAEKADLRQTIDAASTGDVTAVSLTAQSAAQAAAQANSAILGKADLVGGKLPVAQIPDAILGGLSYQAVWNAASNSPAIPVAAAENKGWYYKVGTAGATAVDGESDWAVGDWVVSNGSKWEKADHSQAVTTPAETLDAIKRMDAAQRAEAQSLVSADGADGASGPVQSVLSRPVSEYDAGPTGTIGKMTHSFGKRFPFRPVGVRVIYAHAGGGAGVAANVSAVVACSDDLGTGGYGAADSDWYFMVPYRGGARKNTVSDEGWQAVTWGGAASTGCADDVFQRTRFVESDYIPLNPIEDVRHPGWYGILCRIYTGDGARTRGGYSNMLTAAYAAARGAAAEYCVNRASTGPDFIGNPEYWDETVARVAQDWEVAPIALRVYGQAGAVQTVLLSGDSRFHISTETASTEQYANFGFYLENAARAAGRKLHRACAGGSGVLSKHYAENASRLLDIARPDIVAHVVYSANDGLPTAAVMEFCKGRALKIADEAKRRGGLVLLVTSYPNVGGFSAPQMALLQALDVWAATVSGVTVFSPLAIYGNSSGDYLAGMGSSGPHMSQAAYQDMAARVLALI